jgi:hypothetical protein
MIHPPSHVKGLAGMPVIIRADNDGGATINGQGLLRPVHLYGNSYFDLSGFNACNSSDDVVLIEKSNLVNVRRVCGWSARDGNCFIFWAMQSTQVLFEDCAGWGIARKIFVNSHYGDYVTFRRCWASWDGSHHIGPKMAFSSYYDSVGCLIEGCVGTWTASLMNETYYLLDENENDGYAKSPGDGGRVLITEGRVEHPISIFGLDGFAYRPVVPAGVVVRNCISYTRSDVDPPLSHFYGRRSTDGDTYVIDKCMAWQGEYDGQERVAFYLEGQGTVATDVECRFAGNNVVKDGAVMDGCEYGSVDVSQILPLPIAGRVEGLTGHDMTRYVPMTRNGTYYAAPDGTGKGLSADDPMSVKHFSQIAGQGDTLILKDGVYSGGENLLQPLARIEGAEGAPVTVKAQNDGQAVFDGLGAEIPVNLVSNRYWRIEGVAAQNSSDNVIFLTDCDDITLKRITASDAGMGSTSGPWGVYCLWNCENVVVENCAGWGTGDKVFLLNDSCRDVTLSQCFGMWERGLHSTTSKAVFASLPESSNVLFDRCVGLWYPKESAERPQGAFICDLTGSCRLADCVGRNRGTIMYPRSLFVLSGTEEDSISVSNVIAYAETPGISGSIMAWTEGGPFELRGCTSSCGTGCSVATGVFDATSVGPWPMQARVLAECGVDVESLYLPDDIAVWFVSPSGAGEGRSESDPMSLSGWLANAKAGDTCYMLDGAYRGQANMIAPLNGVSGTATEPITVAAVNEGMVFIDGQQTDQTVRLSNNNYWRLEGLNIQNSSSHAVELDNSDDCQLSRICAWDELDSSIAANFIYYSKNSENVLFEDCAGWGRAVQIFSLAGSSYANIYRRCWASWEGTDYYYGNKIAFSVSSQNEAYANVENCIGRWKADTSPYYHPYGVFGNSGGTVPAVSTGLENCIAYIEQLGHLPAGLFYLAGDPTSRLPLNNCLARSIPPNGSCRGFYLWSCSGGPIRVDGTTLILKEDNNTVQAGQVSFAQPFFFPINSRVNDLTGHNVLTTLGLD